MKSPNTPCVWRNNWIAVADLDGATVLGELQFKVGDITQFVSPPQMR